MAGKKQLPSASSSTSSPSALSAPVSIPTVMLSKTDVSVLANTLKIILHQINKVYNSRGNHGGEDRETAGTTRNDSSPSKTKSSYLFSTGGKNARGGRQGNRPIPRLEIMVESIPYGLDDADLGRREFPKVRTTSSFRNPIDRR